VTGQHAARSPTVARVLTATAALTLLGVGAWAGLAMREPGSDVAGPPTDPAISTSASVSAQPDTSPGSAEGPPADPTAPPPVDSGVLAFEEQVVALVNAERASVGCPSLAVDTRLATAARAHSTDMATRGYFDHTTPEGVSFVARIDREGYSWSYVAENIAVGQQDPASVMASWMDSDGHRRNILNCGLRHIGVGLAYDDRARPHWTQDFGTPA
jgi:uncharacterized protein YkwD